MLIVTRSPDVLSDLSSGKSEEKERVRGMSGEKVRLQVNDTLFFSTDCFHSFCLGLSVCISKPFLKNQRKRVLHLAGCETQPATWCCSSL